MTRKAPIFGIVAVCFLAAILTYLFLFFAFDEPVPLVESGSSPAIALEGFAYVVFAILVTVAGLVLSAVSACVSLFRNEKRVLSLIALSVSVPFLVFLLFSLFARA